MKELQQRVICFGVFLLLLLFDGFRNITQIATWDMDGDRKRNKEKGNMYIY